MKPTTKILNTVSLGDRIQFEINMNGLLEDGWEILSSNCGFWQPKPNGFQEHYIAILQKTINKDEDFR